MKVAKKEQQSYKFNKHWIKINKNKTMNDL